MFNTLKIKQQMKLNNPKNGEKKYEKKFHDSQHLAMKPDNCLQLMETPWRISFFRFFASL